MNNILHSIKLDYYILKSSDFRRILIVAVIAIVVGFLSKDPPITLGIIMMISGFFMGTIFAVVEKNNLNKLYGVLPVARNQTVIGRYIFTALAGVCMAAVATLLSFGVSLASNVTLGSGLIFSAWLCGSLLLFSLLVTVQFPLYFKYDFSKLAAIANLPYILVIIGGSYVLRKYPQFFGQTISYFTQHPSMIWVTAIGGALVLFCISTVVSITLYKTREL
jgi:hypothetical protein